MPVASGTRKRIFLLSPARASGRRAALLLADAARFDLAHRLQTTGISLGEAYAFMSGLYFRGKLAYAAAFGCPPAGCAAALIIAPGRGLVPACTLVRPQDLRDLGVVPIDLHEDRYVAPLVRDAHALASRLEPADEAVLLGSIATDKYVGPLLGALGDRLRMPLEFVGRGDMSRGGLMLRCASSGAPLTHVPIAAAVRRGPRPPRLGSS